MAIDGTKMPGMTSTKTFFFPYIGYGIETLLVGVEIFQQVLYLPTYINLLVKLTHLRGTCR